MTAGERLRHIRLKNNMTVQQLSSLSNVGYNTIYRFETGQVETIRLDCLKSLIVSLGCTADELLFDDVGISWRALLHDAELLPNSDKIIIRNMIRKFLLVFRMQNLDKF